MSGKFNFKVKIVQTDLTSRDYFPGFAGGMAVGFGGESPVVYQNSSYISKLYFINNYSGGILAKEKIEDMPERYRRFIRFDNPSEAQMIKNIIKENLALANREEVGQNVFYSHFANPFLTPELNSARAGSGEFDAPILFGGENPDKHDEHFGGDFPGFGFTEETEGFEYGGGENPDEPDELEKFEELEELLEEYEDYEDDEEIRNILHLNSFYNSDAYKMSRVEYDFSASGDISLMDDGHFIELRYDEGEMTGFKDSYIQFIFDAANRDMLTIRRKYLADVWFTLEKGKRVSVAKSGKASPHEHAGSVFTVSAKELANNMTADGGAMRVSYIMEEDGVPIEKVSYVIRASRAAV